MSKIKKTTLQVLPYFASILAGLAFYLVAASLEEDIKGLFVNVSAAFLAIPLLYLFYQLVLKFSHRKLNREIFDYAKMQIDREILSIVNQLYKETITNRGPIFWQTESGSRKIKSYRVTRWPTIAHGKCLAPGL